MLTGPVPVVAVAALLAAASYADAQHDILPYKSSVRKGLKSATMRELSPNYIPDKQCSGLIEQLSCPPLAMQALEVVVLDREQYAEVHIDNSLASAQVFRRPNEASGLCEGEAHVTVSLSCGGYRRMLGAGDRRRRRRSPRSPRSPRYPRSPRAPRATRALRTPFKKISLPPVL